MLVIDYVKFSGTGEVIIPPFHTGHLGFIPGTAAHIAHSTADRSEQYEVIVTPFHRSLGDMFRISCDMEDRPGVVAELVQAVADLGINISTQVSSSTHQLRNHVVELIVDASRVDPSWNLAAFDVTQSARRKLSRWCDNTMLDDPRCVALFQSIVSRCGSWLRFDRRTGHP